MKSKNKTLHHLGFIALAFAGLSASSAQAANTTWVGNTDANFGTLANWNAVTPNGNSPIFGVVGTSGTTLNNDIVGATYWGLVFNSGASAYTIGGNSFTLAADIVNNSTSIQTINNAMSATASRTFNAASGQLVLGGNITDAAGLTLTPTNKITLAGTNTIATTATGTNTFYGLLVNAGAGGVDITGSTTVGTGGTNTTMNGYVAVTGTTTVTLQSGGSLAVNGSTNATSSTTPNSIIGQNAAVTSTLLVNGGTLTIGANSGFILGNGNNNNIAANGVLTISSGTATINRGTVGAANGTDTRLIEMGKDSNSATGTINLNGGTLATDRQFVRDGSSTNQAGTADFVFGGGTLKALGTQTDWLQSAAATSAGQNQGTTGGTVNASALALSSVTTTAVSTIDPNGFSVAINSAISGAGGFNINSSTGTGTVTFGGANTYSGTTTISAGRLNVVSPGSIDNTSAVSLGAATLGGNGSVGAVTANNVGSIITNGDSNTDTLTLDSLAFSASGTANLNLTDLNTPIAVTNTMAIGSGFTVNVATAPSWITGQTYDLISYGTLTGSTDDISMGTISGLGARQDATIGDSGFAITLTIDGVTPVWTGAQSNAWTTEIIGGSKNWKIQDSFPVETTDFLTNDQVLFDDTATGTTDINISTANVQVASVVFNNSGVANSGLDYTISSSGGFGIADGSGSASFVKNGDGTVTLKTLNSYTGVTSINAGTLQLGDGTTDGDIATSSAIANDGNLILNRSTGSFTYANVISGVGGAVKNGTGTQIFSGSNTYFGDTTINDGILQVGSGGTTGSLGSGSVINDATLVFNRTNSVVQGTDFGLIEGTGSVTQAGSGAVTLSFGNTYSGGTNITSGSVIVGATDALGTGSVTLAGGTLSGSGAADITLANALVAQASTTSVLSTNGKNLTLNGNLTGSGNINRTATGAAASVFLGGDNSGFSGTFTVDVNGAAATRFNAASAGSQAAKWVINQGTSFRATLDFAGGTIKFGSLTGTGFLTHEALGVNTIEVGALGLTETFSGVLNQAGAGSTLAVTKVGAGTWTLTGTNTYTGDTTVNAGVLAVDGDAIANANKLVINGGKVDPMGATEVVGTLYFGAAQQASGTYSAVAGPGVDFVDTVHFTGTGVVEVTTGPASGYSTWATTNVGGQTPSEDYNNDGVDNGIAYFMNNTGIITLPGIVGGAVTWTNGGNIPASAYGTQYGVQTSPDLVNWAPVVSGDLTTNTDGPGGSLTYTLPTGQGKFFVRLIVTPQ